MFKRILILFVLFILVSCRQNTAPLLVSPPSIDDGMTDEDNSEGDNTGNGNTDGDNTDSDLEYGYYNVYILGNADPQKLSISNTDKMLQFYSDMILNADKSPKFKLTKNDNTESYTFDEKLNLKKEGESSYKKFRGVCIVRIYPDAPAATMSSLSIGDYTIAGVYTEMPATTENTLRAMTKSKTFQTPGYDELIILRPDKPTEETVNSQNINYRADILFNDDEGINFYYYNPDRTFKYQNINYIFERIVSETTTK